MALWTGGRVSKRTQSHSGTIKYGPTTKTAFKPAVRSHLTMTSPDRKGPVNKSSFESRRARSGSQKPCCFRCEGSHRLEAFEEFKGLTTNDRLYFCIRRKLCFSCLGTGHSSRDCGIKKPCSILECSHWHHVLLHEEKELPKEAVR